MPVNDSGYKKKVALMKLQLLGRGIEAIVQDAAAFLNEKIADEIINGQAGTNYPKNYPSGVSKGNSGYVGVVTGQLKASITHQKKTISNYIVFPDPGRGTVGEYFEHVAEWARQKYGMDYMQIGVELWGDYIKARMERVINEMVRAINRGRVYNYQNPF